MVITKEGYRLASLPVEVKNGETTGLQVTLEPVEIETGAIAGTLKDTVGKPVAEAMIIAELAIACAELAIVNCMRPVFQTFSDRDGNYKLGMLPALEGYLLTAQKEGFEKATKASIQVTAGQTTTVGLVMNPLNAGIELLLQDENANPLSGMMARVSGIGEEFYQLADTEGKAVFYVKPGDYTVTAPVEQFYRLMGEVLLTKTEPVADVSLSMPVCYPD